MNDTPVLELKGITKAFSGNVANDNIRFSLNRGEIHAILGENGAGKSTLMNIISGLYTPDQGDMFLNGLTLVLKHPRQAIKQGIGMVHQHFMLVPGFTVFENIILGEEDTKKGVLDVRTSRKKIESLSQAFSLDIPLNEIACELPVGLQQRVEIFKALFRNARILIFDEPTAVLSEEETRALFKMMDRLKKNGVSIIFITHKLMEAMHVSDRISVMRRGRIVYAKAAGSTDEKRLTREMIGRDISRPEDIRSQPGENNVLHVKELEVLGENGSIAVDKISFNIRSGEILGIAGVQGNGQTELVQALTGLREILSGSFRLNGRDVSGNDVRILREYGMAHIPEDRLKHGLVLSYAIWENQLLGMYHVAPFSKRGILNLKAAKKHAAKLIEKFDIRATGPEEKTGNLSGGNQQKIILSRELSKDISLLIANNPMRGLDIGAIAYVKKKLLDVREKGAGVLIVSSEIDELMGISDSIAVMYRGKLSRPFDKKDVTKDMIGKLMMTGSF